MTVPVEVNFLPIVLKFLLLKLKTDLCNVLMMEVDGIVCCCCSGLFAADFCILDKQMCLFCVVWVIFCLLLVTTSSKSSQAVNPWVWGYCVS